MKVYIDANVLVAVLNKEMPVFTYAARVLSLAQHPHFTLYTSPICLAIAFYFAEKKSGTRLAKEKMVQLCNFIEIIDATKETVKQALADKRVQDFEDGMQYYAALNQQCTCIVTEDTNDFNFSSLTVYNCKDFLTANITKIKP
jgi:predicted nucleic acid-binding protein